MSEFIYTLDEALDIINQGRVKDRTYSRGGISSYSFGYSSGTGGVFTSALHSSSTFGGYSGVSETKTNPFWVTKGMLKQHIANHFIQAKKIDGQWYLSDEGIHKIKQYYKRKEIEYNERNRKMYLKVFLIVIVMVAIGILILHFLLQYDSNKNKLEQQRLWEQQQDDAYRKQVEEQLLWEQQQKQ